MIYTNEDIKKEFNKKQRRGKIFRAISIPIIILILGLTIYVSYNRIVKKNSNVEIFGYKFYTVLTGSMEPEFNIGDIIIEKPISKKDIKVDTIITYELSKNKTVTHRVVQLLEQDGEILYRTKGDNNSGIDTEPVKYEQVQGTIVFKINKLGKVISEFVSGIGVIVLIILVWISYIHSSRCEEKRIAREDARRRFNVPKYKKEIIK